MRACERVHALRCNNQRCEIESRYFRFPPDFLFQTDCHATKPKFCTGVSERCIDSILKGVELFCGSPRHLSARKGEAGRQRQSARRLFHHPRLDGFDLATGIRERRLDQVLDHFLLAGDQD